MPRIRESSRPHFQSDADLTVIIFDEMNTGLLESFLYFDDSRELFFLNAFVSFNALAGSQSLARRSAQAGFGSSPEARAARPSCCPHSQEKALRTFSVNAFAAALRGRRRLHR
jgi:hypothetical protein